MKVLLTVEDIIHQAAASDAYRDIHLDVIRRVCESEARKGLKNRELVKSVRSRLHQIGGAYMTSGMDPVDFFNELSSLPRDLNSLELQTFCLKNLELHASTKERLLIVDHFFQDILADLPPIHSVLDLACGLTPLALPWMPLQTDSNLFRRGYVPPAGRKFADLLQPYRFSRNSRRGRCSEPSSRPVL